jgi:arginine decarboxylase
MTITDPSPPWTPADSDELYRVSDWGRPYFRVSDSGHLEVTPMGEAGPSIDLYEVVRGLDERGYPAPVIIGFPDLLRHRMQTLATAFDVAIRECEYRGAYTAVYPIKVNQHRYLVEEVERAGRRFGFGLEVGSKPELLAVMGLTTEYPDRLIVCNGFKEEHYIRHVLLAGRLGRRIVAVIENIAELEIIIRLAQELDVRPRIGVRVKLSRRGSGRWNDSSGEKAKFGLTIPGVLEVVRRLREVDLLDCLQLLHCHMGSQITDIQSINVGVGELTQVYVELRRLGAPIEFLDVGGGLGVDYDGSQTAWEFSTNYTLEEYATTVVYRVMSLCDDGREPHPEIVTEAGRAMVSQHSVLVTSVLGTNQLDRWALDADRLETLRTEDLPRPVADLLEACESVSSDRLQEAYHDAAQARHEALTLFGVGHLSLAHRGLVDQLYWTTCLRVTELARGDETIPEELEELVGALSDTYFLNLSVFQSLPDAWAIDQIFPVVPIHRLNEAPTRRATLADITCDSDGKIDRFVDLQDVASTLPVHSFDPDRPYYLGLFLVGAYQETLGDLHNLFGDTHLVHVSVDDDGRWSIHEVVEGDTVTEVLGYLQYDPRSLYAAIRRDCERAVLAGQMTVAQSRELLRTYDAGLAGYTYLE